MTMDCRLPEEGEGTKVMVDSNAQLSGAGAPFRRAGIITEIANLLIADWRLGQRHPDNAN